MRREDLRNLARKTRTLAKRCNESFAMRIRKWFRIRLEDAL